jgi:glycosyltransferase involved in cell wall biosynthesis
VVCASRGLEVVVIADRVLDESRDAEKCSSLRVAMLAPPWIAVPPPGYGGIESVVAVLTEALVAAGHDVTLLAAPGSRSSARVCTLLERSYPNAIERALHEADHVARAFALIDEAREIGEPFDVVHDHSGFVAFAMADRLATPLLHTLHGPFDDDTAAFYGAHADKGHVAALSHAQLEAAPENLRTVGVIPNPIDVNTWPLGYRKEPYLLWIGRMTEEKGPHIAIEVARRCGMRLVLAGVVQPTQERFFAEHVEPHLDGDRIRFAGEVDEGEKRRLYASAAALLMPIRWPEPFGMVMVEAMVCGTPVLAFARGAAQELVIDGLTGFLVDDAQQMAEAVGRLGELDAAACREAIAACCDAPVVATQYEAAYRTVATAARCSPTHARTLAADP